MLCREERDPVPAVPVPGPGVRARGCWSKADGAAAIDDDDSLLLLWCSVISWKEFFW